MPFLDAAAKVIRPEHFGAVGSGADDTSALVAMAAAVNASTGPVVVVIDGTHRTTKTIQFTRAALQIRGAGKLIKGGPISAPDDTFSDTDDYEAASVITLAGAKQRMAGLTFDNDGVDGETNGYGRAVAVCADDVTVDGVTVIGFVNGIEVGWGTTGFGAWSGTELRRPRIVNCNVLNVRAHHDADQTSIGAGIRSYASDSTIIGNTVQASDSYVNLELLHGIKFEGLAERHVGDLNDDGGVIACNTVIGPFQHSIYVEAMDGVSIACNVVRRTGREGVAFQGNNTVVFGNIIDVGGYQDSNKAAGIRSLNGKNYRLENNIISPWRNVSGSSTGHYGILLGTTNGHGVIRGNTITRNASVRTKYSVTNASGSFVTGAGAGAAVSDGNHVFRVADSLAGGAITLSQGNGWFEVGSTVSQTGGWTADISAWVDPIDVRLERGIDCSSYLTDIADNKIDGVADYGIYLRYGNDLRVLGNTVYGYTATGIIVQDYSGSIVINRNEVGNALSATGSGIYVFTFSGSAGDVLIKGNRLVNNVTALRLGSFTIGTKAVVSDNTFTGNTTNITNARLTEITYRNNDGYKTLARGQATIANGATSVAVAHGLVGTPAYVSLTARGNVGALWPTSIGGTNLTINCASAPGSNTSVDWVAEVGQPS